MSEYSRVRDDEPIRLFKSDFLEFFSHISPVTVIIVWTPVLLYLLWLTYQNYQPGTLVLYIPLGIFLGWFVWTFVEYTIHRFIFHYHPKTEKIKRYFFLMHGVHHAQPMCKTRLVMPPVISFPLAGLFYVLFYLVVVNLLGVDHWLFPMFTGFIAGYLVYDIMHYNIHHSNVKSGKFFEIRKHHLRHHGKCDFMRYGVTSPFWDQVFGTLPREDCPKTEK
jgi:sterol desaturase/sphingolipid hydroxylase (fatty acid hydroxylase superfamily)